MKGRDRGCNVLESARSQDHESMRDDRDSNPGLRYRPLLTQTDMIDTASPSPPIKNAFRCFNSAMLTGSFLTNRAGSSEFLRASLSKLNFERQAGLEPTTSYLEGRRSIIELPAHVISQTSQVEEEPPAS